jgi:hypothetical protein
MSKFIHHDRIDREWFGEEDGYDVIETNDGFNVYQNSMHLGCFDTLQEATDYANEQADEDDRKHSEEERQRIVEARELGKFRRVAGEIADVACFQINRQAAGFSSRYPNQHLLEEVISVLQQRV